MNNPKIDIDPAAGFDWDDGNRDKNKKNGISFAACEEVFFQKPLLIDDDVPHSADEIRFIALGVDQRGRRLFVSFTLRRKKIRVISARPMSRQERRSYEKTKKENPDI